MIEDASFYAPQLASNELIASQNPIVPSTSKPLKYPPRVSRFKASMTK